jgi:ribosomal protein S18 acetylase RimI-like enzyme
MTSPISIRRLLPADAPLYRAIRLEALERNPEAFGSTLDREAAEPLDWFAERLNGSAMLGAWHAGTIVATAGVYWATDEAAADPDGPPRAHLWGVYVQAAHRGTGLGQALLESVIDHVRPRADALHLRVNTENGPALRLYQRLGFEVAGIERNSLERGGRFYDEFLMVKRLNVSD